MKFTQLRLKNFGKFIDKKIEFAEGINLIYGDNESGKSTLHSGIEGMLFGIERQRGRASKEDTYLRYQPWETPSIYGGSLDIQYRGKEYRIYRNFHKENKEYKVIDVTTGREIHAPAIKGVSFICGLTEDNYRNTISIKQLKARTEQELAMEVSNHIANLSMSGSNQVDIGEAMNHLALKKKSVEGNQTEDKIKGLEGGIRTDGLEDIRMDQLSSSIKQLEGKIVTIRESSENNETGELYDYISAYPGIREKFSQLERLRGQKKNYEKILKEQEESLEKSYKKNPRSRFLYFILTILIIAGMIYAQRVNHFVILSWFIGSLLIGGIFYVMKKDKNRLSMNQEVEKDRIHDSVKEISSLIKEEEKYILDYGSRICEMSSADPGSMKLLEEEMNVLKTSLDHMARENRKKEEEIRIELERLKWELNALEEKELNTYEKKAMLNELKKKHMEEEKEKKAISLAMNTMKNISLSIHDGFGQKLNSMVSYIMGEQTGGKYVNIKVDEQLNIKTIYKERFIELDKLSVGTIEQFYLALRLSVARLIFPDEIMPLLLDDTFAYFDDDRLKGALGILGKEKDRQIIIFTCQRREERLLKELKIPFQQINLT